MSAAFGRDVDLAQIVKNFGVPEEALHHNRRYSPIRRVRDQYVQPIIGQPDLHITRGEQQSLDAKWG